MAITTRSGIPTTYEVSNFRSRLEARWAAFFDLVGWRWTYEPIDADGYIPDFLIHGERPLFVEVGPCITEGDYQAKLKKAAAVAATLGHDILVVGVSPISDLPKSFDDSPIAGLLGEFWLGCDEHGYEDHCPTVSADYAVGPGHWTACRWDECGRLGVFHGEMSFASRPCGHYDGDHHLGRVSENDIDRLWREAGNRVQWRSR